MKTSTKQNVMVLIVLLWGGLFIGTSMDNERRLIECVDQTEGTDTDCEQCYESIYGYPPTN